LDIYPERMPGDNCFSLRDTVLCQRDRGFREQENEQKLHFRIRYVLPVNQAYIFYPPGMFSYYKKLISP